MPGTGKTAVNETQPPLHRTHSPGLEKGTVVAVRISMMKETCQQEEAREVRGVVALHECKAFLKSFLSLEPKD